MAISKPVIGFISGMALFSAGLAAEVSKKDTAAAGGNIAWQTPKRVASGPAEVGPWRMNDSQFYYVDDGAASIRADGDLAVVWVDNQSQAGGAPALASDGDNKLYVVWEHYPRSNHFSRGLGFAASLDSGHTFTPPQVVPGSSGREGAINGSLQGDLGQKIAANEQGEWVVTNSLLRRGRESRVVYIRGR